MNSNYLYTIEENSLFVTGKTVMADFIDGNGGWWAWISCYFTQFFYYPWLGSSIIIALWTATYYMSVFILHKAYSTMNQKWDFILLLPLLAMLYDILSYGYWIYYTKYVGFAYRVTTLYFALTCICFIFMIALSVIDKKRVMTQKVCRITLAIAFCPFIMLMANTKYKSNQILTTLSDTNFRHELSMYRAVDEGRWQDVLDEAPKITDEGHARPTNLMVMFKNIALVNTDQVFDLLTEYDNRGVTPSNTDNLHVAIARQAAPMLYYRFGFINYAYRWAMENSVRYHPNFDLMKMMVRCATFNQEIDVAMKYITILKSSLFHRQWACEWEAMLLDKSRFTMSPEFISVYPLIADNNELDNDGKDIEGFIYEYFSNILSKNPRIEELALMSSLQIMHEEEFMIHFYYFTQNHPNVPVPRVMQEAAIMLGPTELSPIDISGFKFSSFVTDGFDSFTQEANMLRQEKKTDEEISNLLMKKYGNTYWWFYSFYIDHKPY